MRVACPLPAYSGLGIIIDKFFSLCFDSFLNENGSALSAVDGTDYRAS
jgi:hypothetical protein